MECVNGLNFYTPSAELSTFGMFFNFLIKKKIICEVDQVFVKSFK